ncbi:MAG: RNA polymerase sigma factor, partial [Chitinophagaceae bacterium]|nr:RNA polymerase sigma factor [Chitinophagaceae bacterium]
MQIQKIAITFTGSLAGYLQKIPRYPSEESVTQMSCNSTLLTPDLIQGCIRNDRRAQELLYKQFCQQMLALCISYTKNQEDAIEVLQDGFLKVFQQIGKFDENKSSLYTWIRTIVLRTAIDFLRKKNHQTHSVELQEVFDPAIDADAVQRMSSEEI